MQSSSMTTPASVLVDEVSLPSTSESCADHLSQSKEHQETMPTNSHNQQLVSIAIIGFICVASIVGLFASAFDAEDPSVESSADCVDSVTSETARTITAFVMGWAFCFIAKQYKNNKLAGQVDEVIGSAKQISDFVCSSTSSFLASVTSHCRWLRNYPRVGNLLALTMVGILCAGCIIALFISAFTAVPEEEPTDTVFASESSQTMKAFTVGWMFLLSFKLRSELVGVVGSSSFLHPC